MSQQSYEHNAMCIMRGRGRERDQQKINEVVISLGRGK